MTQAAVRGDPARQDATRSVAAALWRRVWLRATLTLTPPLAWFVILQKGGTLSWTFQKAGLGAVNIGYTNTAMWLVFSYIWLPFMIVPVYGAMERIPDSLLEASGDLGARGWRTLRSVLLPLAL